MPSIGDTISNNRSNLSVIGKGQRKSNLSVTESVSFNLDPRALRIHGNHQNFPRTKQTRSVLFSLIMTRDIGKMTSERGYVIPHHVVVTNKAPP